ncbi:MAG: argininosuccinate lyase [Deltaproteobacteria bacterium]|nr:argininosuccinate lyase [Deltaproteobacteria bacterium]
MSKRLWDKGGVADAEMMSYTARDDWQLDQRLLVYDLRATVAHVRGLHRIGAVDDGERDALVKALDELTAQLAAGQLQLSPDDEDGHSAIEGRLVDQLGAVGKKVHTGRSRNDQVLVALRLYERDALDQLSAASQQAALALLDRAEREADTPMPGYTHLQRAVPSSVGLWLSSIAEGLADGIDMVGAVRQLVNRSPLGGAAGYGVNLPLDRDGVAQELDFADLALNPMASQASRGVVEVQLLTTAWQLMMAIRRFAWDVSLFATSEFGFVKLAEGLTTGSSIMPNKRNPDVVELMRAACGVVQGAIAEIMAMLSLPSGYHRDGQLTKAPLLRAIDETLRTLRLVPRLVDGITFDHERMRAAISPECFATDRAVDLTRQGVPFREAYRQVAAEIAELEAGDPEKSLAARVSPGAPGALDLARLRKRLED